MPELFMTPRGLIDEGRRSGRKHGRFLVLGSAAIDLLRQSGETLAGRTAYIDLGPFDVLEALQEQEILGAERAAVLEVAAPVSVRDVPRIVSNAISRK